MIKIKRFIHTQTPMLHEACIKMAVRFKSPTTAFITSEHGYFEGYHFGGWLEFPSANS